MRCEALAIGFALLLGSAGCATSQFDQYYEARRFAAAARAFDADPSLHDRERALFRAGVVHALPRSPAYDPDLAQTLLQRLLLLYPETAHREEAGRLLGFLAELERLEERARRRQQELEREIEKSTAEIAHLRQEIGWLEARIEVQQWHGSFLRKFIDRLETDLEGKERELQALQTELERLKEIDLGSSGLTDGNPPAGTKGPASSGRPGSRRPGNQPTDANGSSATPSRR